VTWRVTLPDLTVAPRRVQHVVIDSGHGVTEAIVREQQAALSVQARQSACASVPRIIALSANPLLACAALNTYCATGDPSGLGVPPTTPDALSCSVLEVFALEFATELGFARTEAAMLRLGASDAQIAPLRAERAINLQEYRTAWEARLARPPLALQEEDVTQQVHLLNGVATVDLRAEPWSVHLLRVTLAP
jgi:hypothetical protein